MGNFFKGWRRKSGIVSLILAFAFAGAWLKSSFDKTVICCPNGNRVDELSMAGKIGFFCSSHRFHKVEITGLYRELSFTVPHQGGVESARLTPTQAVGDFSFEVPPPWAKLEESEVTPVSYQTEASNAEESSSSALQNLSDAESTQIENRIGLTFDLEKQVMGDSLGNTWAMDSELAKELAEGEEIDEGLTTSKWQVLGFYANWTQSLDGGWNTSFLVPHGSIVIPLMLLSGFLLLTKSQLEKVA